MTVLLFQVHVGSICSLIGILYPLLQVLRYAGKRASRSDIDQFKLEGNASIDTKESEDDEDGHNGSFLYIFYYFTCHQNYKGKYGV